MPKRRTLVTGVRGTDNCPICGRTLKKTPKLFLNRVVIELKCCAADHEVRIYLDPARCVLPAA